MDSLTNFVHSAGILFAKRSSTTSRTLLKEVNVTSITLVAKKENPDGFADFRRVQGAESA